MLEYLRIRNYALIDDLKVDFENGFNVLTGETGAGKSIIIGALSIILGEKASTEFIRTGEKKAVVEATFDISNSRDVANLLENSGIDFERSEPLIIRREINSDGKNRNYINSTPVPLSKLKQIGDFLVDIHGQHEHQSLLKINTHIDLLDRFGHLDKEKTELAEKFNSYQDLKNMLEKLQMNEQEKERLIELLKFSIDEIEKANLQPGEDIELEKEFNVLNNQEKIVQSVEKGYSILYGSEDDMHSRLNETINQLTDIEKFDPEIVNVKQKLEESYYLIEDAISLLRDYKSRYHFSPERLDIVIERIELIKKLKKKYGETIEDILAYMEKSKKDLEAIEKSEAEIDKIKSRIEEVEKELNKLAINLSGRRKVVAKLFQEKIVEHLNDLDMKKCIFKVNIQYQAQEQGIVKIDSQSYKLTENGIDHIEFLIAPNIGEQVKPLRKIASGGEMSRIMLALKTVLNEVDKVNTLIFDEIDVGIGGKTSDVVGKKMKFLSQNKQVILITHQPQIARYAKVHFYVQKQVENKKTFIKLYKLSRQLRIKEIARMVAGDKITQTSLKHARELLEQK